MGTIFLNSTKQKVMRSFFAKKISLEVVEFSNWIKDRSYHQQNHAIITGAFSYCNQFYQNKTIATIKMNENYLLEFNWTKRNESVFKIILQIRLFFYSSGRQWKGIIFTGGFILCTPVIFCFLLLFSSKFKKICEKCFP